MTEQNDYPVLLFEQEAEQPAGRRRRRAKHLKKSGGKRLSRLGVSCLALLLVTALLLVNGSFSQYSSQSSTGAKGEGSPTLTVAAFNVEVNESSNYDLGQEYGDYQYVAYAFDVYNDSQVLVKCNIELNIAARCDGEDVMDGAEFYFCEDGGTADDAITKFDGVTSKLEDTIVLSYNSEADGGTFDLPKGETKTFVLVMDLTSTFGDGAGTASNFIYLSNNNPTGDENIHAITVTAEQATEEEAY